MTDRREEEPRSECSCPSLRNLCLQQIAGAKITMPNVLAALELSHTHDIPEMRHKAERFLRDSWRGVRARHANAELKAALGSELLSALEREQAELDAAVRKLKTLGDVAAVSPPPAPPPLRTQRAAAAPSSDDADARRAPARRFNFGGPSEKCVKCGKTVYKAERLAVDRQGAEPRVYHHACFRCKNCDCKLVLSNFEMSAGGDTFCRAHFAQARARAGDAIVTGALEPAPPPPPSPPLASAPDTSTYPHIHTTTQSPPTPSPASEKCERCGKTVYAVERQAIDGPPRLARRLIFHASCFRCADCSTLLRPGTFELVCAGEHADECTLVCRTHYLARRSL